MIVPNTRSAGERFNDGEASRANMVPNNNRDGPTGSSDRLQAENGPGIILHRERLQIVRLFAEPDEVDRDF